MAAVAVLHEIKEIERYERCRRRSKLQTHIYDEDLKLIHHLNSRSAFGGGGGGGVALSSSDSESSGGDFSITIITGP